MAEQKIYFMQHGLAVDKTVDPERPLSEAGIEQTRKMAESLYAADIPLSSIYHSGKLRATQTAEVISTVMNVTNIAMAEGLLPNDDVNLLAKTLNNDDALYIGHLPHLEKLVTLLITGQQKSPTLRFQNSAIVCLVKSPSGFRLNWFLPPALC